jgi:hypothetical protein|tara:strand:+ start:596 stop:820 length:225 start_codon:yes stop_codon:yes gene_type:complete
MANTTFSGPVTSTNGFIGDITVPSYTVANAPSAATAGAGTVVYISNGAAGSAILAFSDGTNWKRSDTGGTISAV